ncbi:hypothetical protein BH10PSE5_BH10PSE5_11850 [soil metagenome]
MSPFVARHAPGLTVVAGTLICGGFWVGVLIGALAFASH